MTINDETPAGGLYRIVWRWHFYAGLFAAPVLMVLAVTGALYLFSREIDAWWYSDLIPVQPSATIAAASVQEAAVLRAYPGAAVLRYVVPHDPATAAEWAVRTAEGRRLNVFVDPGSATVKGAIDAETRLMAVVREIHAGLFMGDVGRYVVELAACWGFILLVTGAYLWWPRGNRGAGALVPRLGAKGRMFWKDVHSVFSLWNLPLIAFLILSGLPWSIFWGVQVAKFGTLSSLTAPTPNFSDQPHVTDANAGPTVSGHHHEESDDQPWAIRNAPAPTVAPGETMIGIDRMIGEARARNIAAPGLRVIYPQAPGETFVLSYVPAQAQAQRTVNVDPSNGAIVRDVGWDGYSPLGMAAEFGVMTHMGEQFGTVNKFVMLGCCLLFVFTIGAGVFMWWRRRPRGSIGAPHVARDAKSGWIVAGIAVVLGLLLPLAGASMIAVLLIDRLLFGEDAGKPNIA